MNWQVSTISVQELLCRWNKDCLWLCHCITLKKKEGACASQTMDDCECQLHPLDFHCPFVGFPYWQKGKKKGSSNARVVEQRSKEGERQTNRNQPKGLQESQYKRLSWIVSQRMCVANLGFSRYSKWGYKWDSNVLSLHNSEALFCISQTVKTSSWMSASYGISKSAVI